MLALFSDTQGKVLTWEYSDEEILIGHIRGTAWDQLIQQPKRIGIGRDATYPIFCGFHDNGLFVPLEKPGIYNETRRAALLAYRALCYKTWNPHLGDKLEFELSNCTPEAAEEFRSLFSLNAILAARNKLEGILLQNDHSAISRNVRWIKRILKLTPCIACADAFVPYKGAADASAIASGQTVVTPEDYVTFTLYPDKDLGASVCIVTCFKGNERGEQFIDDLDPGNSSDDAAFNRIFNYALSMSLVYTSQAFWDFLSPEYKEEYVRLRMSRVSAPGGE